MKIELTPAQAKMILSALNLKRKKLQSRVRWWKDKIDNNKLEIPIDKAKEFIRTDSRNVEKIINPLAEELSSKLDQRKNRF